MSKYLFVFNVVGLSQKYLPYLEKLPAFSRLMTTGITATLNPVFPCLTMPGQASLVTGTFPNHHGMIANGLYDRERMEVGFWDQYRSLLQATPVWERIKTKSPDLKTAVLFWQNTLHAQADFVVTPKPIHAEHKMIQWCYSKPVGLYEALAEELGPFNLMNYWGPLASPESSKWITRAAISILQKHRPNLMMIYIPHLDYSCQRFGPEHDAVYRDLQVADQLIGSFLDEMDHLGITEDSTVAVLSEYALTDVSEAILPNRLLRDAGFLAVRDIEGGEYLDIEMSRAFAMVDHQIAHIYIKDMADEPAVYNLLAGTPGVDFVIDAAHKPTYHMDHSRSGELIAVSASDRWFAYYWWHALEKAPDFAGTVDIHRKPGYDPLELFFDPKTKSIPLNTSLIKGSHGAPAKTPEQMGLLILSRKDSIRGKLRPQIDMLQVSSILEDLLTD
ncbi:MAG: alkaline phosphatase family protein [Desulfobacterales bacterium]|jgi:predicted AlkP superfamily pyrophosphatase or phosphodiesterase|nr:alkaline phosphatase family protein [Desulfobacterales bacterium]